MPAVGWACCKNTRTSSSKVPLWHLLTSSVQAKRPTGRPQMTIAAQVKPNFFANEVTRQAARRQVSPAQVKPNISRKQSEPPACSRKRREIRTGPDGVDEKCFQVQRVGRDDHPLGELACCNMLGCTAACLLPWRGLPGSAARPWHCPKCTCDKM